MDEINQKIDYLLQDLNGYIESQKNSDEIYYTKDDDQNSDEICYKKDDENKEIESSIRKNDALSIDNVYDVFYLFLNKKKDTIRSSWQKEDKRNILQERNSWPKHSTPFWRKVVSKINS
jgi:hypothetical protein